MTVTNLADARLSDLCRGTVGVRSGGTRTACVNGSVGHGTTYLEAFADALRRAQSN